MFARIKINKLVIYTGSLSMLNGDKFGISGLLDPFRNYWSGMPKTLIIEVVSKE